MKEMEDNVVSVNSVDITLKERQQHSY